MPNFVPGKLHFKNNFCDACRESTAIGAERIVSVPQGALPVRLSRAAGASAGKEP